MRKFLIFITVFILLIPLAIWANIKAVTLETPKAMPISPQTIISLAPSLSETLFALDLDNEIVGVTRFCNYPEAARHKPKVAGFSDVNYEAVLRQNPDLIVVPYDKVNNINTLRRIGLCVAPINNRSLAGLRSSVPELGQLTGHKKEALALSEKLDNSLKEASLKNNRQVKPKVLFVVMRSYQGLGDIKELQAVGRDGFYDELITLAGGQNAYRGTLAFPKLSREGILKLDPDIIIDVIPPGEDLNKARQDWQGLSRLKALQTDKLLILNHEAATVPGPRFPEVLEQISTLINSEGF